LAQRNYPDWIGQYLKHTQYTEAPSKFHFWTAVSVIAGALRRRVWIDQGYFQWVPNFYIIFVSPPGIISKSTTADIGMRLLKRVPGIKFGPNSLTWQSFTKHLAESTEGIELPDGTIYPMSALTIVAGELGSLLNFEDREMIDVFVDLWDGRMGQWHRSTKTSGEDKIQNAYVNILGCTTPAWIRKNFDRYLLGGGFTSRTIFVFGSEKRNLEAYPGDRVVTKEFEDEQLKLVQDLEAISQQLGSYKLTKDAKEWGQTWYKGHYERYKSIDPSDEGLASFLARKQTQMHKLGMVLAASKHDKMEISKDDLLFADKILESVEKDLPEIFGRIADRDEVNDAVAILQIIAVRKKVHRMALFRMVFNRMSAGHFESALGSLITAGKAKQAQHGTELYIEYIEEKKDGEGNNSVLG
jgi:hypothetical protein